MPSTILQVPYAWKPELSRSCCGSLARLFEAANGTLHINISPTAEPEVVPFQFCPFCGEPITRIEKH